MQILLIFSSVTKAMLPAIIFICSYIAAGARHYQDRAGLQKGYKNIQKRYYFAIYKNSNDEEYKVDSIWNNTVLIKELEASYLSEICLSSAASTILLGNDDGKEKLPSLGCLDFDVQRHKR